MIWNDRLAIRTGWEESADYRELLFSEGALFIAVFPGDEGNKKLYLPVERRDSCLSALETKAKV
jgi:hypothetical protein